MADRDQIITFCDELLDVGSFDDYGPNGLQVPGAGDVAKVASAVSASRESWRRRSPPAPSWCSSTTASSGSSARER